MAASKVSALNPLGNYLPGNLLYVVNTNSGNVSQKVTVANFLGNLSGTLTSSGQYVSNSTGNWGFVHVAPNGNETGISLTQTEIAAWTIGMAPSSSTYQIIANNTGTAFSLTTAGNLTLAGTVQAGGYLSSDGTAGLTQASTTTLGKSITVKNGLVTAFA